MAIRNLTRLCYLSVFILCVSVLCYYWSHIAYTIKVLPGEVQAALVSGIFLLLTSIFAYVYGLRTYFRQREHERMLARYLDGGIDCVIRNIDRIVDFFMSNILAVQQAVNALESDKSIDPPYKVKVTTPPILEHSTSIRRLSYLLGDSISEDCIGQWYGTIKGQIDFLDRYFRKFFSDMKQLRNDLKDEVEIAKCYEWLKKRLDEQVELSNRYAFITKNLNQAALILEKETSLRSYHIDQFRNRKEVKQIVESMKTEYQSAIQFGRELNNQDFSSA